MSRLTLKVVLTRIAENKPLFDDPDPSEHYINRNTCFYCHASEWSNEVPHRRWCLWLQAMNYLKRPLVAPHTRSTY